MEKEKFELLMTTKKLFILNILLYFESIKSWNMEKIKSLKSAFDISYIKSKSKVLAIKLFLVSFF